LDVPHVRSNRKKMLQYFQTWKPWSDQFMPPQFWCMKSQFCLQEIHVPAISRIWVWFRKSQG
jgi:hypothetical protein